MIRASPTIALDVHARIERRIGILKDDLDVAAQDAKRVGLQRRGRSCLRNGSRPRSARSGEARSVRWSTCRNRIRRPGRGFSARSMVKSTPSTACTLPVWRPSRPPVIGNSLVRFQTLSNGSLIERPSVRHGCMRPRGPVRARAGPVARSGIVSRETASRREAAADRRVDQLRHGPAIVCSRVL